MEQATALRVLLSDTNRLVETVNKQAIGRVVETRQVAPRKRVKLTVQKPLEEPDYKAIFENMRWLVNHHGLDKFFICDVCRHMGYGPAEKKLWVTCAACDCHLCYNCLPDHESDTVDAVHVFYCHGCRERVNDTPDTEDGYQELMVQFDCYTR